MIKSAPNKIIDDLCCRSTKVRFGIISIFHQTKKPLSANEIITILAKDYSTKANKTTIYRQLEFLESKKILNSIDIDGTKYFQFNKTESHQVLVCTKCHDIIPIKNSDIQLTNIYTEISNKYHFKINRYSFLFFGNCQKCQ